MVGCWRGYLSGRGADLHIAQLMPLPLTVSCFSKIQIGFTFLVPAHPGSVGKRADKGVLLLLVSVCRRIFVLALVFVYETNKIYLRTNSTLIQVARTHNYKLRRPNSSYYTLDIYSAPSRGAEDCDEYVRLCVCPSICEHISEI